MATIDVMAATMDPGDVNNVTVRNIAMTSLATQKTVSPGISWDDATWILTSAFIIFTMQSGFGLLEAGCVNIKNEVNIMVKNAVDVIFGGLTYWAFGYGISFGEDAGANWFCGVGNFMVDTNDPDLMGIVYSNFIFQLSFATTATTIVSGAMAERTNLTAYIIFSMLNTIVYVFPAHWIWSKIGFLSKLGVIDIAGSGGVHLVGGTSGLVAAMMLGPRTGRYDKGDDPLPPGNATNAIVGMFMLWWGWLGFNCGSTFGISGGKWKLAAKSAVTTINSSMGGGFVGITYSYIFKNRKYHVDDLVNSVLGGLVAITGSCAVVRPWQAVTIGMIGGLIAINGLPLLNVLRIDDPVGAISVHGLAGSLASCAVVRTYESVIMGFIGGIVAVLGVPLFDKFHIDDPVGALAVHGLCGIWGMLAVGLFADVDRVENLTTGMAGLFHGGGPYLLGVQVLACLCIIVWSGLITFILLFVINCAIPIRMSEYEEMMGADFCEHDIVDSFLPDPVSETGSARRRSSFGLIRYDGGASPMGSLHMRSRRVSENGAVINTGEAGSNTGDPTQIVISTIEGTNIKTIDTTLFDKDKKQGRQRKRGALGFIRKSRGSANLSPALNSM